VVTDLPINNSAPTSYSGGAAAWGYPYSIGNWPPYAQHIGGMVYFGPHFPQYYGYPYAGGAAAYPSAQFGYPSAAAVMFDPMQQQQAAGVAALYQYPMQAQSMIPAVPDRLPLPASAAGPARGARPASTSASR
jgi:hypothetical protein